MDSDWNYNPDILIYLVIQEIVNKHSSLYPIVLHIYLHSLCYL